MHSPQKLKLHHSNPCMIVVIIQTLGEKIAKWLPFLKMSTEKKSSGSWNVIIKMKKLLAYKDTK